MSQNLAVANKSDPWRNMCPGRTTRRPISSWSAPSWNATTSPQSASTKDEQRGRGTPDFKLLRDGRTIGYCEVKASTDFALDDALDAAPPMTIVGNFGMSTIHNRIERAIASAAGQLASVNADGAGGRNFIAIVNYDDMSDAYDLQEAIVGYLTYDGEPVFSRHKGQVARVQRSLPGVDAILWFDRRKRKLEMIWFTGLDQEARDETCRFLGQDPTRINEVPRSQNS